MEGRAAPGEGPLSGIQPWSGDSPAITCPRCCLALGGPGPHQMHQHRVHWVLGRPGPSRSLLTPCPPRPAAGPSPTLRGSPSTHRGQAPGQDPGAGPAARRRGLNQTEAALAAALAVLRA